MPEKEETPRFTHYQPAQRERLQGLVQTPEWAALLARRAALQRWKADVRVPPAAPAQLAMANRYLKQANAGRVHVLLQEGVTDEEVLVEALGD